MSVWTTKLPTEGVYLLHEELLKGVLQTVLRLKLAGLGHAACLTRSTKNCLQVGN